MSAGISVEKFDDLLDQLFYHILLYPTLKLHLNLWKIKIFQWLVLRGSPLKWKINSSIQQILRFIQQINLFTSTSNVLTSNQWNMTLILLRKKLVLRN